MKRTLTLVALCTAFVAVSLWVWLSRGKNAKAVRAKFRLGGAIIALTSLVNLTSCGPDDSFGVTCYDPAPMNEIYWENYRYNSNNECRNGEAVEISCYSMRVPKIVVTIENRERSQELQRATYDINQESITTNITHTIDVGEFRGEAMLIIWLADENTEPYEYRHYEITITE
jgi:hypothetical protein